MDKKSIVILPLATALSALTGNALAVTDASSMTSGDQATVPGQKTTETALVPNTFVSTGENLLGFIMTDQADGTIVAQHVSHASHASHASHVSSR